MVLKRHSDSFEYEKAMMAKMNSEIITTRYDIINYIIKKNDYKRYLEIGISNGDCFKNICIDYKDSVDPVKGVYVKNVMTSDEYFYRLDSNFKFDIVFIDGLHLDYQVYTDIINSLKHIQPLGTIVCHDMNPPFEVVQREENILGEWNGNCWKAFVRLKAKRSDLEMCTIDTDWGLGIIKYGRQKLITIPENMNYTYLELNRQRILNLISVEEFYKSF